MSGGADSGVWTIRAKLGVIMILALAPPMVVLSLVTTRLMQATLAQQAAATRDYVTVQNSIGLNRDLSHLRTLVVQRTERLEQAVTAAIAEGAVGEVIANRRFEQAGARLASALAPSNASMITIIARDGTTVARATNPTANGDHLLWNQGQGGEEYVTDLRPLARAAFAGAGAQGVVVLAPAALHAERVTSSSAVPGLTRPGDLLSDQARIPLATGQQLEVRGLAIAAVVPVPDARGTVRGAAIAARLLNCDPELARTYRAQAGRWMAACLGDVVVEGDFPASRGRIVGQIIGPTFTSPILQGGKERSTGHLAAAEIELDAVGLALHDLSGTVVGLLVTASPVTELQRVVDQMEANAARLESRSLVTLLIWLAVGAAVALTSAMLAARNLIRPIRQLQEGARRIGEGQFSYRLNVRSGDELEQLAAEFNQMADRLQQARDQERLAVIGRMASTIAHDIQNALTTIRAAAPLLAEKDLPPEQREEFSAILVESVQRIADMARDLLEFARGEPAHLELRVMSVDEYLDSLRPRLERDLRDSRVRAVFRLGCSQPVRMDPERMNRVIFNLVANARDAMGDAGVLTISSRCEDGYAEIQCSDTGPGLPPEMQGRLFQPFASYGKSFGTGLGLVICRQVVEAHGGTIEARSAPGAGATFVIRLPLAQRPGQA